MPTKNKVTFVVPENLQKELRARVIKDDYGMRGKSTWIVEAIENLLKMENYPELVFYSSEMKGFEKTETAVITRELKSSLDEAVIVIRRQYPLLEGVQSSLVRTAILQRLLR